MNQSRASGFNQEKLVGIMESYKNVKKYLGKNKTREECWQKSANHFNS